MDAAYEQIQIANDQINFLQESSSMQYSEL